MIFEIFDYEWIIVMLVVDVKKKLIWHHQPRRRINRKWSKFCNNTFISKPTEVEQQPVDEIGKSESINNYPEHQDIR